MKIIQNSNISPFGGLNFVLEELDRLNIKELLNNNLPKLSSNSKYQWKDILYSFWSIYFCGGNCIEDLGANFKTFLNKNPFIKVPSPDRVLSRFKELATPKDIFTTARGKAVNEFNNNQKLSLLNIRMLKKMNPTKFNRKDLTLDYDNSIIYAEKFDAKRTYKKEFGYQPGIGLIGSDIIGVHNRNGNSVAHTLQEETLKMFFENLKEEGIKINSFRADSASYKFEILNVANEYAENVYVRVRMSDSIYEVINKIENWNEIKTNDGRTLFRASSVFTPFKRAARDQNKKELLKEYRIVVTKEKKVDGQINMFTNEAFVYSCIMTNNFEKTDDDVVFFYNQRGKAEREFDVLKNDFGWDSMPFSKLEQNTVFLLFTAMCRNIYNYIIHKFSGIYKHLNVNFRIKKFIFRFICIPAKWIKHARGKYLRVYGNLAFKT